MIQLRGMQLESIIILWSIIMFLTLIHEFGHFIVAKWCGVHVDTFAIGFGPNLLIYEDKKKTKWCWNLIPLGGYVEMSDTGNETDAMLSIPPFKRMLVALGGPLINILFFLFGGTLFYHYVGFKSDEYRYEDSTYYLSYSPRKMKKYFIIQQKMEEETPFVLFNDSPLLEAVFQKGEKIKTSYNILNIKNSFYLCWHEIKSMTLNIIGIFSSWESIKNIKSILYSEKQIRTSLETTETRQEKIQKIILYLLMFSLNLGIFNLLPLFGLDGCWVLISFLGIFFKPKESTQRKLLGILNYGTLLVFALFFFIIARDLFNILWGY